MVEAQNVVPLRILKPEPACEDQLALILIAREILQLAQDGVLHSLAVVFTRNDSPDIDWKWQTLDGSLADIVHAVSKLHHELLASEE